MYNERATRQLTNMNTIDTLRAQYGQLNKISFDAVTKIRQLLKQSSDEFILQLIEAKIKFISKMAINQAVIRGIY